MNVFTKARHPEKAHKPDNVSPPRPDWICVKAPNSPEYMETRDLMRGLKLHTVCEEAACPNIGECWKQKHATFMILGSICTRACAFCNVATGKPDNLDPHEPQHVAEAVAQMGLSHVVITSVDRDDLQDGGAAHFAETITQVRAGAPDRSIEILTPDFMKKAGAIEVVAKARPDVFNHNLETVPRLYPAIRPGARYFTSLHLLKRVKELDAGIFTKSGVMVGLGETREEVGQVMDDLRAADVDFLTIGQYLQPTPKHVAIDRYVAPEEFESYATLGACEGVPDGVQFAFDPFLASCGRGFQEVEGGAAGLSNYSGGGDFFTSASPPIKGRDAPSATICSRFSDAVDIERKSWVAYKLFSFFLFPPPSSSPIKKDAGMSNGLKLVLAACVSLTLAGCVSGVKPADTYTDKSGKTTVILSDEEMCKRSCNEDYGRCMDTDAASSNEGIDAPPGMFGASADCRNSLKSCLKPCGSR